MPWNGGRLARRMRSSTLAIAGVSRRRFGSSWLRVGLIGEELLSEHTGCNALPLFAMARIQYLTQIEIDFGAVRLLPEECARAGITRPLVVTDAGVRAAGVLDRAIAPLKDLPHAVFDGTPPNPTEAAVRAATAMYAEQDCD